MDSPGSTTNPSADEYPVNWRGVLYRHLATPYEEASSGEQFYDCLVWIRDTLGFSPEGELTLQRALENTAERLIFMYQCKFADVVPMPAKRVRAERHAIEQEKVWSDLENLIRERPTFPKPDPDTSMRATVAAGKRPRLD